MRSFGSLLNSIGSFMRELRACDRGNVAVTFAAAWFERHMVPTWSAAFQRALAMARASTVQGRFGVVTAPFSLRA